MNTLAGIFLVLLIALPFSSQDCCYTYWTCTGAAASGPLTPFCGAFSPGAQFLENAASTSFLIYSTGENQAYEMPAGCTITDQFGDSCNPTSINVRNDMSVGFECDGTSMCVASTAIPSSNVTFQVDIPDGSGSTDVINCADCTNPTTCTVNTTSLAGITGCIPGGTTAPPTTAPPTTAPPTTAPPTTAPPTTAPPTTAPPTTAPPTTAPPTTAPPTTAPAPLFEMIEWAAEKEVKGTTSGTGTFVQQSAGATYNTQADQSDKTSMNTAFRVDFSSTKTWATLPGTSAIMASLAPVDTLDDGQGGAIGIDSDHIGAANALLTTITFTKNLLFTDLYILGAFTDFNTVFDFTPTLHGIQIASFFSSNIPAGKTGAGNPFLVQNGVMIQPSTFATQPSPYIGNNITDSMVIHLTLGGGQVFGPGIPLQFNYYLTTTAGSPLSWASITFTLITEYQ